MSEKRSWYRPYVAPVAFLVALLTLVTLWEQIGLPRPALSYEMEAVLEEIQVAGAYQQDTREMLLRDRLAEKRYLLDNATSQSRKRELQRDIDLLLRQIKDLRK